MPARLVYLTTRFVRRQKENVKSSIARLAAEGELSEETWRKAAGQQNYEGRTLNTIIRRFPEVSVSLPRRPRG